MTAVPSTGPGNEQTAAVEHVDLSGPGEGLCSCGAKPSAGELISSWWAQHTEDADGRRDRLTRDAVARLTAAALALTRAGDSLRALAVDLDDAREAAR